MMLQIAMQTLAVSLAMAPPENPLSGLSELATLTAGRTGMQNALWSENDLSLRFQSAKRVVVANIEGPATITMMHFAMPSALRLNRDVLLKIYWDGETAPSVDCPLVDFFCDLAGLRDEVNTALVNKRRGYNTYFPMPFRKSARVELVYDGPVEPGEQLWRMMPCYSYVMYRTSEGLPLDMGFFHAHWRQAGLLLGRREYVALETQGRGKFVGWNVTIRQLGHPRYPVDENEKFFIDGEAVPSIEFQGLEDSFGFSWGFPPSESLFPLTGYFPFLSGAAAYRFFVNDAISFDKSLRVTIGFGTYESPSFAANYSKPDSTLHLSSVVYWYQAEPHAPLPPMPSAEDRTPAKELPLLPAAKTSPKGKKPSAEEPLPSAESWRSRGVRLAMYCGRADQEVVFADKGYAVLSKTGYAWQGWDPPVHHARADQGEVEIELAVPKGAKGRLRVFVIDPDNYQGGRKEVVAVARYSLGLIEDFQGGRWLEQPLTERDTAEGKISVRASNARDGSNAVISKLEWVEDQT